MQGLRAPKRCGLVHGRIAQAVLTVRGGLRHQEDPDNGRVAVAAGPMQRRGACLVGQVYGGFVLQKVQNRLRGAAGAVVVQGCAAFGVNRVQETPKACVELQEEKVPVERSLEEVRGAPWVLPGRDAQELVPPIPVALVVADLLPLAQHGAKLARHLPLRRARGHVVVEEVAVARRLHCPATPEVQVPCLPGRQQRLVRGALAQLQEGLPQRLLSCIGNARLRGRWTDRPGASGRGAGGLLRLRRHCRGTGACWARRRWPGGTRRAWDTPHGRRWDAGPAAFRAAKNRPRRWRSGRCVRRRRHNGGSAGHMGRQLPGARPEGHWLGRLWGRCGCGRQLRGHG
mmetsp:Transcript_93737/g.302864  ORF Transcript_93737/g.302864 Transcript_93737/m.302864 type:complete len:342 (+) Transcript_93737:696-1721(+)